MSQKFTTAQLNEVTRNAEGQVIINPEIFTAQIEIGWKADKFQSHYEITASDLKKILKALGLQIRKFHKPKFVIAGLTDLPSSKEEVEQEEEEVFEEEAPEEVVEEKPKTTKKKSTKKVKEEVVEEVSEEDLYTEPTDDADFSTAEEGDEWDQQEATETEAEEVEEEVEEDDDEDWV